MSDTTQRRVILWGRYSSDKQGDGDSRERQERNNRRIAKERNIKVIGEYFDEGVSVKDGATQLFKQIISELPADVGIICENLDRISRGHPWRSKAFIADIIEAGHFIITYQDGREYTNESIDLLETLLMGDMQSNLAFAENAKRKVRVNEAKDTNIALARQGKPAPLGAWLPGYVTYNFDTREYVINETCKGIIKRIFREYLDGKGCANIARGLNKDKIATFRRKGCAGWIGGVIRQILTCEAMIGTLIFNGERIQHAYPSAISDPLFYKVQAMFARNTKRQGNYQGERVNNILRGILRCHKCNSTMRIYIGWGNTFRIQCNGYRVGKCDQINMLRFEDVEYEFAKWFIPLAKEKLLGKDSTVGQIETLTGKRQELQKRIEATISLLDSGVAVNEVSARLNRLVSERKRYDNAIETAKAKETSAATNPETIKALELLLQGIRDNQEIRRKVAILIPSIVKVVKADISEKYFPVFTCELINGDVIEWSASLSEMVTHKDGTNVFYVDGYKRKENPIHQPTCYTPKPDDMVLLKVDTDTGEILDQPFKGNIKDLMTPENTFTVKPKKTLSK